MDEREETLERQIRALAGAGLGRLEDEEAREADAGTRLASVLAGLRRALAAEAGSLYLEEHGELVLLAAQSERVDETALSTRLGERTAVGAETPAGWVAQRRQPLRVDDVYALDGAPRWDPRRDGAGFRSRALLALPLEDADGGLAGVLELLNPRDAAGQPATFAAEDVERIGPLAAVAARAVEAERLERGFLETAFDLAVGVEEGDPEIRGHVRRVSGYSAALARAVGCSPDAVRWIRLASPLHDVGKVGLPPQILYKPGRLTDEEFDLTKRHTEVGARIFREVGDSPLFQTAAEVCLTHHERWDGSGYPRGLRGEHIPLAGRVVAVADVFDALTTKRIYKPALGIEQSLKIIRQESARHFDPRLVDAFQGIFAEILDVKSRFG